MTTTDCGLSASDITDLPDLSDKIRLLPQYDEPKSTFLCQRFRTSLSKECCAKRQLSRTGFDTPVHLACAAKKLEDGEFAPTCPQGKEVLVQLGWGREGGFDPGVYSWFRSDFKEQKRAMWRAKGRREFP